LIDSKNQDGEEEGEEEAREARIVVINRLGF